MLNVCIDKRALLCKLLADSLHKTNIVLWNINTHVLIWEGSLKTALLTPPKDGILSCHGNSVTGNSSVARSFICQNFSNHIYASFALSFFSTAVTFRCSSYVWGFVGRVMPTSFIRRCCPRCSSRRNSPRPVLWSLSSRYPFRSGGR